ncbi:protein phosphatase 2C domain-containing protein [Stackebrandtia nassauensis]|uniref:PPM-type phosphatase domain-containing protein n=1 Tax=Stackebrandtia nassauensis (strain DSM 44728 / CIP 108903 / NRRL B-16338 / NBRC 102104 / LLR-40K-21) TaxID=446470 RepID=D3PYI3_STANL|nr:protein phosphatase 2C domain-containing protein [Stackebrandtia nassauensis]ADD41550.1 hypothetical protein Snas_1854 [Stackebrandtia nassauensis DSM 44728]
MEIAAATLASPGSPNDDTYIAGQGFAAVLDGATAPKDRDSGCVHDVPWLVARLSGHLAALLTHEDQTPLPRLLAATIERTRADHGDTCDLSNPDSPSSTVTVLREGPNTVDYLVLGDSPLVLRGPGDTVQAIVDDRVEHLPSYTYEAVARLRNSPEGFWVASTDVGAAGHALTGSLPRGEVTRALLLTDGASRLADRYGRDWPDLLVTAEKSGPQTLLNEVRAADATAPASRGKRFDDATAVWCRLA